jgi:xylulokinase
VATVPTCRHILAVDLGTTSIKAGILDCTTLEIKSYASTPSPVEYPREGWSQQDPDKLWSSITATTRSALEKFPRAEVSALVFSTYLAGLILLDEEGNELSPLITWLDERAHDMPREVFSGPFKVAGYNLPRLIEFLRITGGAPSKTGKDPISKIVWVRENWPDLYEKTSIIGGMKTWILSRTTGKPFTSPDEAHLTWLADTRNGVAEWSRKLAKKYGIPLEKLPRIVESTHVAGRLRRDPAEDLGIPEGIPVVTGAGDVATAAVGSGAVGEREYHVYIGTSNWIGVHTSKRLLDIFHYIGSLLSAIPRKYLLIAEQETAGAVIDWLLNIMGRDYSIMEEASEIPPGSNGLLMTPWFYGERCPIDDPHARGIIIGLTLRHTPKHLVRAAMESVALNIAWAMHYAVKKAGEPRKIRGVGGGFRSRVWAQIIASAIGREVEIPPSPEHAGLRGAAIIAIASLEKKPLESVAKSVSIEHIVKPDKDASIVYRRLLKLFARTYKKLKDVFVEMGKQGKT